MQGSTFWEVYSKVIPAVCVVVAAMLAMQGGLSTLKFKSTAAQATASQMQVVGSTIEASILRWEQLGLGMGEMKRLPELISFAASQSIAIDHIMILDPVGGVVQATDELAVSHVDRGALLRRVLSVNDVESVIERNDWIYAARRITGSTGAMIGVVVMAAPTSLYVPQVASLSKSIGWTYVMILFCVSALVLPIVIYQFRGFTALYLILHNVRTGQDPAQLAVNPDIAGVVSQLRAGQQLEQDIRTQVDALARGTAKGGHHAQE